MQRVYSLTSIAEYYWLISKWVNRYKPLSKHYAYLHYCMLPSDVEIARIIASTRLVILYTTPCVKNSVHHTLHHVFNDKPIVSSHVLREV